MATKAVTRKKNVALMFNPSRGLSIGGRSSTRSRTTARKSNPTKRTSAITNPRRKTRRRRNPAGVASYLRNPAGSGVIVGALTAGVGLAFVDMLLARIVPSGTPTVQVISKVGVGFVLQQFGDRVPVLGKYKDGIAFVLYALAAKQLADSYLLPTVRSTFSQVTGQFTNLLNPAPAATTAGLAYRRYA